jgi:hypothetical protein
MPRFCRTAGQGCAAPDPIFIVGLPRAGSTLVEQILASHSQVEAIAELPDIPELWGSLGPIPCRAGRAFGGSVARAGRGLSAPRLPQRKTDRPLFIDKLPNNWLYVGFIKAILPNARIVDVRRHPLSAGVANFRQHFARGQHFAYDLADLGHYYRDYVRLMGHFDAVLPGAVHRIGYEDLVEDSEGQIRALLEGLNLPFEDACLQFHKTKRPVRTPSSEQVRSPFSGRAPRTGRRGTHGWGRCGRLWAFKGIKRKECEGVTLALPFMSSLRIGFGLGKGRGAAGRQNFRQRWRIEGLRRYKLRRWRVQAHHRCHCPFAGRRHGSARG